MAPLETRIISQRVEGAFEHSRTSSHHTSLVIILLAGLLTLARRRQRRNEGKILTFKHCTVDHAGTISTALTAYLTGKHILVVQISTVRLQEARIWLTNRGNIKNLDAVLSVQYLPFPPAAVGRRCEDYGHYYCTSHLGPSPLDPPSEKGRTLHLGALFVRGRELADFEAVPSIVIKMLKV